MHQSSETPFSIGHTAHRLIAKIFEKLVRNLNGLSTSSQNFMRIMRDMIFETTDAYI